MTSVIFDEYGRKLVDSRRDMLFVPSRGSAAHEFYLYRELRKIKNELVRTLFVECAGSLDPKSSNYNWKDVLEKLHDFMRRNFKGSSGSEGRPLPFGYNSTMALLRYLYENTEEVEVPLSKRRGMSRETKKVILEQTFYLLYMSAKLIQPERTIVDERGGSRIFLDIRSADLLAMLANLVLIVENYSRGSDYKIQCKLEELVLVHFGKQVSPTNFSSGYPREDLTSILRSVNPRLVFEGLPPKEGSLSWVYSTMGAFRPGYGGKKTGIVDSLTIRCVDVIHKDPPTRYAKTDGAVNFELRSQGFNDERAEELLTSLRNYQHVDDATFRVVFGPELFSLDVSQIGLSSYDGDRSQFFDKLLRIENTPKMNKLSLAGLVRDEDVEKLQVALSERARQRGSLEELNLRGCQFNATSQRILCEILEVHAPLILVLSEQDEKGEAWQRLKELNQSNVAESKVRRSLLKLEKKIGELQSTKENFRSLFNEIFELFRSVEKICDSRRKNFFIREVCEQLNKVTQAFIDYCKGKDKNDEEFQKIEKLQKFMSSLTPLIALVISAHDSGDDEVKEKVQKTLLLLFTALLKVVMRQGYEEFVGDSSLLRINDMDPLATAEFASLQDLCVRVKSFSDAYKVRIF